MNWHDLVPQQIAIRQIAWERRAQIVRALTAGATIREISEKMGLSRSTVYQLRDRAKTDRRSPVERYLAETPLHEKTVYHRQRPSHRTAKCPQ